MQLNTQTTIQIRPTSPFNFNATFFKPDHFTTDDHEFVDGIRWQTMNWQDKKLGLKYRTNGTITQPIIEIDIFSQTALTVKFMKSLKEEIIYRYNLQLDINEFYDTAEGNKPLAKAISNLKGMRPGHPSSLYEYLIIGIILQNASVRRSIQMFKNLLSNYGLPLEFDGKKLLCLWDMGAFEDIDEQDLRDLKIGYRAKSIKRLDQQFTQGLINEFEMRNKDVLDQKTELLSLYGVGPATVWYLLFDVFHHWGFFEHISPWEQKLYSRLFFDKELVSVDRLLQFIDKLGKYKHLAVHYLWEDLWWRRFKGEHIDWLEKEIRT